jgi:hypothetical protein
MSENIDKLAQEIRRVDGSHSLGAGALAEALWPYIVALRAAPAPVDPERVAQLIAHRACCGTEADPANGKLHGYCVVCGVDWPCEYAGKPPTPAAAPAPVAAFDFCWLVELFLPYGGNSLGFYHTGFTHIDGASRTTKNPHEAKQYATRKDAEYAASKLESMQGEWRAIEHGFERTNLAAPTSAATLPEGDPRQWSPEQAMQAFRYNQQNGLLVDDEPDYDASAGEAAHPHWGNAPGLDDAEDDADRTAAGKQPEAAHGEQGDGSVEVLYGHDVTEHGPWIRYSDHLAALAQQPPASGSRGVDGGEG